MSLRVFVALMLSLLLHGWVLFRFAPLREDDAQLPPGAGSGIEAEEKGEHQSLNSGRDQDQQNLALPVVRLAALASIGESQQGRLIAAAGGAAGGGNSYLGIVRAYLNAKARSLAGRLAQRGVVEVLFEIAADGSARDVQLSLSSGFPALDIAALTLVRLSAPLPPPPQVMRLRVPIEFQ